MRAVRLVVDTGLHTQAWPREKGIEMMRLAKEASSRKSSSQVKSIATSPGRGRPLPIK